MLCFQAAGFRAAQQDDDSERRDSSIRLASNLSSLHLSALTRLARAPLTAIEFTRCRSQLRNETLVRSVARFAAAAVNDRARNTCAARKRGAFRRHRTRGAFSALMLSPTVGRSASQIVAADAFLLKRRASAGCVVQRPVHVKKRVPSSIVTTYFVSFAMGAYSRVCKSVCQGLSYSPPFRAVARVI